MPFKKWNIYYKTNWFQKWNKINLWKKYDQDRVDKVNNKNRWQKRTPEQKKRISDSHIWQSAWNKWIRETREDVLIKLSNSHIWINSWEKCHLWRWWISSWKYPKLWCAWFRNLIRIRDNNLCQECWRRQEELNIRAKKLSVHHIDYNKNNLDEKNLISLCSRCHSKTNSNRDYWKKHLTDKNEQRF